MSRSRGARSLTRSPPMMRSPEVMSSSPAIMRIAVAYVQVDRLDGLEPVWIPLRDLLELDLSHQTSPPLVSCPGMAVPRPWCQDQQQPCIRARSHFVALVRVEHRGEAGPAARRPAAVA